METGPASRRMIRADRRAPRTTGPTRGCGGRRAARRQPFPDGDRVEIGVEWRGSGGPGLTRDESDRSGRGRIAADQQDEFVVHLHEVEILEGRQPAGRLEHPHPAISHQHEVVDDVDRVGVSRGARTDPDQVDPHREEAEDERRRRQQDQDDSGGESLSHEEHDRDQDEDRREDQRSTHHGEDARHHRPVFAAVESSVASTFIMRSRRSRRERIRAVAAVAESRGAAV